MKNKIAVIGDNHRINIFYEGDFSYSQAIPYYCRLKTNNIDNDLYISIRFEHMASSAPINTSEYVDKNYSFTYNNVTGYIIELTCLYSIKDSIINKLEHSKNTLIHKSDGSFNNFNVSSNIIKKILKSNETIQFFH